jgi:hypothetical protein
MNDTTTINQMHQTFRSWPGWLLPFMAGTLALLAVESCSIPQLVPCSGRSVRGRGKTRASTSVPSLRR